MLVHPLVEATEEAPYTGFAGTKSHEVIRVVGLLEIEVLVLALEPAILTSDIDDILLIHAVLLVTKGDLVDACLVSMGCDGIVGDADRYPGSSLFLRTLPDHFHDPDFILICDSEGFPRAVVAVVTYEIGHDADRLTSRAGALECYIDQATIVHDPRRVGELFASAPGALSDSDLMLIHIPHDIVGYGSLRDVA